jgi:hypothetical protein
MKTNGLVLVAALGPLSTSAAHARESSHLSVEYLAEPRWMPSSQAERSGWSLDNPQFKGHHAWVLLP